MPKAVFDGTVLASSERVQNVEGNLYFPREAVDTTSLEESDTAYTCPWKGAATYYHLRVGDRRIEDAAWSYPDPEPEARHIAGHVAFDTRKGIGVS